MTTNTPLTALRPGVALGAYPENTPAEQTFIERTFQRLFAAWNSTSKTLSPTRLDRFVRQVNTASREFTNRDFRQSALDLRRIIASQGLQEETIARCFGLVRNVATEKIGLRHYDCQIKAGRIMLEAALVEMETGEGKTLAATLPACTAALAGIPVHVVTANDYLVTRDAAAMGAIYRAMGLSVGAVTEASTPAMRRAAYARDICYVTSKQLAFDYLRDRIAMGKRRGAVNLQVEKLYNDKSAVDRLMMRGLCFAIIDEADSVLIDEARTPFIIAHERESGELKQQCQQAIAIARSLKADEYHIDTTGRRSELSAKGQARVDGLTATISSNLRSREAMVELALSALHLFDRDRDYIVRDGHIQIIDPNSGRVMPDRSWNRGLQQMIELKENCVISAPRDTLARLSFQRFYGRYLRLSGMTGTAIEVSSELWSTYRLPVIRVAPNRPTRRRKLHDQYFSTREQKWRAITNRIKSMHQTGRPILVGTRSVADSELLGSLLDSAGLKFQMLNARQDAAEADIIAMAGSPGQITVATNMAGRGTDICLGPGVEQLGGLHVLATERNDAHRIDRQLFGRCGRHGEPGSYEFFNSAEDELLRQSLSPGLQKLLRWLASSKFGPLMLSQAISFSQRRCERRHRIQRRQLAIMQDQTDRLLSFSGTPE